MTTTTATRRLWAELAARFAAEPEHYCGGRCRDCAKPLTDADRVCRDVPMGGPIQ